METQHTLYEWCFINKLRPTMDIEKDEFVGDDFMTRKISLSEFKEFYKLLKFKENSTPRKPKKYLELRMYRLVPYNISDIQKGIQFDHAKDDYYNKYFNDEECMWFRTQWFTTIALNGGTSNEGHAVTQGFKTFRYTGTMQQHLIDLRDNDIKVGVFYEPDLNSMLTAINFIVDERVWDKELYPDFVASPLPDTEHLNFKSELDALNKWGEQNDIQRKNWVDKIGGPKNEFLRMFLADKRLA